MCGILASWNVESEVVNEIIKKLSIRGRDGYGYYAESHSNLVKRAIREIYKFPDNAEMHIDLPFTSKIILANSRAVPTTEYETGAGFDTKNQQPFENKRYVVVHNGIISNDKALIKKYNLMRTSKVDSALLPDLFSKVGVVEGMKLLKGSFAILCWDKKDEKLYVGKNFMPLRFWVSEGKLIFVSLEEMLPDNYSSYEVEPYTCLVFNSKSVEIEKEISLYPRERNKKVLVICSSGIDSTTTAYLYKYMGYEVTLLHFLYGQAAEKAELFSVEKIAEDLKSTLIVYDAKKTFEPFKNVSKLLNQKKANPKDRMLDAESVLSYVPNRNAIFAMIACGIAEMIKCDTVAMGLQQTDSVYPDNNPTYMNAVDKTIKYSLSWGTNIKFTSPLIHLIKHEIIALGKEIGVNYDLVCSCYYPKLEKGKVIKCETCGCCQYWIYGMKMIQEKRFVKDRDKFIDKYVKDYL
jgi:7-cyano-7-deazaguanine synthase